MIKLNYLFCDGMILQRDREVAIWGESDSSVKITIDDICVRGEVSEGVFLQSSLHTLVADLTCLR